TLGVADRTQEEERAGGGEQRGVEAVEHPAVTAEQAPGVLDLHVALQRRLEQVSERPGEGDQEPKKERVADGDVVALVQRVECDEHGRGRTEDEALPGLARR